MPKIRVTEVVKVPAGTARFQDTVPALKNAYLAKVSEGKVTSIPNYSTTITEDGYTTSTTISIWNNRADYEAFKNWGISNYGAAKSEYYFSVCKGHEGKNVGTVTTEQEE